MLRRIRWKVALIISLVLIATVIIVVFSTSSNRLRAEGSVDDLAFSPDGRALAAVTSSGLTVWSLPDQRQQYTLPQMWRTLSWSPDGELLAGATPTNAVQVFRARDATLEATLEVGNTSVERVIWSPEGSLLAIGCENGTVQLWQMPEAVLVQTFQTSGGPVWDVAFSPDSQAIAATSDQGRIIVRRVHDGAIMHTLQIPRSAVLTVAFSPDGRMLASGHADTTVRLWDAADGHLVRTLNGHTDHVNTVVFSPDGKLLASSAGWTFESAVPPMDTVVRLWRVSDGALEQQYTGHRSMVTSIAFSPDGKTIATGGWDRIVRLWTIK